MCYLIAYFLHCRATIISACVAPFSGGDTPLQHYNMALSLATAGEVADAIVFWDNDDLMSCARSGRKWAAAAAAAAMDGRSAASSVAAARAAVRAERSGRGGPDASPVSTWDLNAVAAEALAGVVAPTYHRGKRRLNGSGSDCEPDGIGASIGGAPRPKWVSVASDGGRGARDSSSGFPSKAEDDGGYDDHDRDGECERSSSATHIGARERKDDDADADGDDDGDDDDRDAWIRDSVSRRISSSSYGGATAATAAAVGRGSRLHSSPGSPSAAAAVSYYSTGGPALRLHALPLDGGAMLAELLPQPGLKYLDCRAASNDASQTGSGAGGILAGVSWADLADRLADTVPRYLSQPSASVTGAAAPPVKHRSVTTLAGSLWVRGARQTDCDSVDPTLPAPPPATASASGGVAGAGAGAGASAAATSGRRGMSGAGIASSFAHGPLWPGLPSGEEWGLVSAKLLRAYGLDKHPAYAPHSAGGLAGLAGATAASAAAALGHSHARVRGFGAGAGAVAGALRAPPLTATLTPARAGVAGAILVPRHAQPAARSLTGLVNSDIAAPRLLACAERVEALLRLRAYVHWYERFGVGPAHLQAAAESLLDTVDAYAAAAAAVRPGAGGAGR